MGTMPINDQNYSQMHWTKKIATEIFMVALIGLVMAFLGPFGTYAMPTGLRIAYWVVFGIIGYAMYRPLAYLAHGLRGIMPIPKWVAELFGCLVAAVPFSFLVAFMVAGMRWNMPVIMSHYGMLYLQCSALGFGIYMLINLIFKQADSEEQAGSDIDDNIIDEISSPSRSALHNHLPRGFPIQIDAMRSEDHYVHVYAHDNNGPISEMILMRLSDAIVLHNGDGFQTHRSWWIARHAFGDHKRDGRKHIIVTHSGLDIPVSQPNLAKLRKAGIIS